MTSLREKKGRCIAPGRLIEDASEVAAYQPDPTQIRMQLERILGSDQFLGSERTRSFLRYVVEETLAGRADRIKAFSVAVATFGRDETFNPQTDPIVRIEAGRLRRFLERYYLVAGIADPVKIEIPKGAYVPLFSLVNGGETEVLPDGPADGGAVSAKGLPAPEPDLLYDRPMGSAMLLVLTALLVAGLGFAAFIRGPQGGSAEANLRPVLSRPSIAVLAFQATASTANEHDLSAGMTNEVVTALSQQSGVFVLGPGSLRRFGPKPDITVVGSESGAAFVLSGDIQHAEDRIRVAVQLSETQAGTVIWAESYVRNYAPTKALDLEAEIGQKIGDRIAQLQGNNSFFGRKSR